MRTFSLLFLASVWAEDQDKVVHGRPCDVDTHPFQAALFTSGHLLCGGVLVDRQWVLTAAHCKKPQLQVYLGKHSLQHRESSEEMLPAARMVVHPGYDHHTHDNDLMLLRLARPVKLSRSIQPLQMETNCSAQNPHCLTLGWGKTEDGQMAGEVWEGRGLVSLRRTLVSAGVFPDTIHCADIQLVPQAECERAYPGQITRSMVCASNIEEGADSCQGDSGGPLVCNNRLRGIVSWGDLPCGSKSKPGVYTNLCTHAKWVQKIIRSKGPGL
ncbi:kallikrein-6 [Thomomys bottae]